MDVEKKNILRIPFKNKIAHLQAHFGTEARIVIFFQTLHQLLGDNPTLEEFSQVLDTIEDQTDQTEGVTNYNNQWPHLSISQP